MEELLICPKCGANYTHVAGVEYWRRTEDAKTGLHVDVFHGTFIVDDMMHGNPSLRRGAVVINFQCESCMANGDESMRQLKLIQHKGQTFIEWEFPS